jgi:predicted NAD-dependent protein-ADP-ribosyltransferase YbiA (DUF1768 family)
MESHNDKVITSEYVSFTSNAKPPFHIMSNFHECEVTLYGVTYPSSEHAFQAQLVPMNFQYFFSTSGPLATLRSGFKMMMPKMKEELIDKKVLFWGKKNNIGIVAKMASKREYLLRDHGVTKTKIDFEECSLIFKRVLMAKYASCEKFRMVLEMTENKYLFEFDRSAERMSLLGTPIRWGAMIKDNKVIGHNQMGALMMWLRDAV